MAYLVKKTAEGLLNLKDLLIVLPPSGGAVFSGFAGRPKRGPADLLILQGLMAKLRRKAGLRLAQSEGVANCVSAAPKAPI